MQPSRSKDYTFPMSHRFLFHLMFLSEMMTADRQPVTFMNLNSWVSVIARVKHGSDWLHFFNWFWLHWVFLVAWGLCLVVVSALSLPCCMRALSSCGERGAILCCGARASHCGGFACCRAGALRQSSFSNCGCGTWAQWLWCLSVLALWHMGSSWTRDRNDVPCIARWILTHGTNTQGSPDDIFYFPVYRVWIWSVLKALRAVLLLKFYIFFFSFPRVPFL